VIQWPEILETGNPEIDADHRTLIEQCNSLTRALREGSAWKDVVRASASLSQGCIEHFRTEERVLEHAAFPRAEAHKAQHHRIEGELKALTGFLSGVDGSQPEHRKAAESLRGRLLDILFRHDLDYKSHLEQVAGR
jgi:hemerythrin